MLKVWNNIKENKMLVHVLVREMVERKVEGKMQLVNTGGMLSTKVDFESEQEFRGYFPINLKYSPEHIALIGENIKGEIGFYARFL